jgi:methylthioribulose-1-phosphate dehydratase
MLVVNQETDVITPLPAESTLVAELRAAGRSFYDRGWVLGTSGNFSALIDREPLRFLVTVRGASKGDLEAEHFVLVDGADGVLRGNGKPSAESALHTAIYRARPEARAVLHTHSVWATLLSRHAAAKGGLEIRGLEMLKGLAGVTTHEHRERVPIIENSQDYASLGQSVGERLLSSPEVHGFLLRGHGLYTWGSGVAEARRHVEIFEFLFEVLGRIWQRGGC